jgi:hypothetical protein
MTQPGPWEKVQEISGKYRAAPMQKTKKETAPAEGLMT